MLQRGISQIPRNLHPGAWWLWALGLATAASRTTNPLLLVMISGVVCCVVVSRRSNAPWALGFRMYLYLGGLIIAMRLVFRIVFGGGQGDHIVFTLPQILLPEWAAGIRLFGPVAVEQLLGGFYDGLRLATMLICLGAANVLANPKRLLKLVPGALYEVGSAVVVALSVAPQLVESVLRVRRARQLRGGATRGVKVLRGIVIPVLEDAVDRSLALAAAMDSRGYGRTGYLPRRTRVLTGILVIAGLVGVCVGVYGTLDGTSNIGQPFLLGGTIIAGAGFVLAGRHIRHTVYMPDRWRTAEVVTVLSGICAGAALYVTSRVDAANLYPSLNPLSWPELSGVPLVAILLGLLPAWLTPPPPSDDSRPPAKASYIDQSPTQSDRTLERLEVQR